MTHFLINLMGDVEISTDAKSIFFGLLKCARNVGKDAPLYLLQLVVDMSANNGLRSLFQSESPLVIHNILVFIEKLINRSRLVDLAKNTMRDIIDLFFLHPQKNIVHARIVNLMELFLRNEVLFNELRDVIFIECDLTGRIKQEFNRNNQSPLLGHLRQLVMIIPQEFKQKDLGSKFEEELMMVPPMDSCFLISDKLRQKYAQNQQLFAHQMNG